MTRFEAARFVRWTAAGLAMIVLAGCLNVSAPESIQVDYGPSGRRPKKNESREKYEKVRQISKDEAVAVARDKAVDKGVDLRRYEIHDKKVRRSYWVLFENRQPERDRSWQNHFAVRVSMFGWSTMFRKPKVHVPGSVWRKVGKKEAYDIARRMAAREGLNWKNYEIHDKEIDGTYWVIFESSWYRKSAGWRNRFAVRVARNGEAELYR